MTSEIERQIIDGVATSGWLPVTYVPGPGDPEEWFTYTVGLPQTAGWPEILCMGLDEDRASGLLRNVLGECWHRGIMPVDGLLLNAVVQGHATRLQRAAGLPPRYFAMADWYAEHSGKTVASDRLQLLWPDQEGRLPDDPTCDPQIKARQTPIGSS